MSILFTGIAVVVIAFSFEVEPVADLEPFEEQIPAGTLSVPME
jgi:hypothetical protein